MEIERRTQSREECNVMLQVVFADREVQAELRNLSAGGALLQVAKEDNRKISSADIDRRVTFRVATNGSSYINFKGKISRCTESEDNKYLAVTFNGRSTLTGL
jgi:hypothetical protein